ncbi:GNAT family N-acetyltransferase [Aureibaculum sp. 2210JD6-5]|uniref:GNAT family N-acetyltransferase n=1 Tax=Aureibaculum sp. 2210JD6-5 TaxID=3103957 RepID=UPI002AAED181|nr:GNAT family N-acetyltransferase [Aureibaculum sp. 2210JD6-5]MDY7396094.1 GNAT family N-acetyltransferase [Aureibaculum sp. 2210JD6-5]
MPNIYTTKRLLVRKLIPKDFEPFHKMQSNINVMRYVRGKAMTYQENKEELPKLIQLYNKTDNDFWIYAIIRKEDNVFVGTVALVKDKNNDDEIGYRFLEEYWGNGYGTEVFQGLIKYCKSIGLKKIVANVAEENIASLKMIKDAGFQFIENFISDDLQLPEQKYILEL